MEITGNIKDAHHRLSRVSVDFLDFVKDNPDSLKASGFKSLDLNNKLYVLQSWPTFVNQAIGSQFQEAAVTLFDLLKSIPQRVFGGDWQRVSAYYEIPEALARLHLEGLTERYLRGLVGRVDFVLGSSGFKCLEFNVTASLGGWDLPRWESLYLNNPIISKFLKEYRVNIYNENLIRQFIRHIIRSAEVNTCPGDKKQDEINAILILKNYAEYKASDGVYLQRLYNTILQQEHRGFAGQLFMGDYHLSEVIDNYVYFQGKRIHVLVEMYNGMVSPGVLDAFRAGNIGLINGPITELLSSKLNMALLSDFEAMGKTVFSPEERQFIDRHVPWSRKVICGATTYHGERIKLEDFIRANKDKLVLKSSIGYGGKSVYVGRWVPGPEWAGLVKTAILQRNWLVQEFVSSSPLVYRAGDNGCELHDMVWGFFVLGSRYGGAWARVIPQKINKGVINCHQGATISVIFHVDR